MSNVPQPTTDTFKSKSARKRTYTGHCTLCSTSIDSVDFTGDTVMCPSCNKPSKV